MRHRHMAIDLLHHHIHIIPTRAHGYRVEVSRGQAGSVSQHMSDASSWAVRQLRADDAAFPLGGTGAEVMTWARGSLDRPDRGDMLAIAAICGSGDPMVTAWTHAVYEYMHVESGCGDVAEEAESYIDDLDNDARYDIVSWIEYHRRLTGCTECGGTGLYEDGFSAPSLCKMCRSYTWTIDEGMG